MSELSEYLEATGELPEDCILGWLVVWSVIDYEPGITPERAKELFAELQLNPAYIPPVPKKIDAFRKATSNITREHETPDGKVVTFMARDVSNDSEQLERHIIREVRDGRRRVLEHTKAMQALFFKAQAKPGSNRRVIEGNAAMKLIPSPKGYPVDEHQLIEDMAAEIDERYRVYSTHLDAQRIRAVIRDYVRNFDAVQVKGSLYFIDKEHTEELRRLAKFMGALPGRCRMNMIPLVDIEDARDMIIEAFVTENREAMNRIVEKCAELQTTRVKITDEAIAQMRAEYDRTLQRSADFKARLNVSQLVDEAAAEAALEAYAALSLRYMEDNAKEFA